MCMTRWLAVIGIFFIDLALRIFFGLGSSSPDLLLLSLIYITLNRPVGEAYCLAFAAGFCWDAVFLDQMGLHAFLYVFAVMITARLCKILWAQYAVSRLVMGVLICGLVRFGEVIFWLSNLDNDVPIAMPERYVLSGAIITGVVFFLLPWYTKPINIPRRSPQTIFADRWSSNFVG